MNSMHVQCYHIAMLNVTFAEINAELHSIGPQLDAAEAHGYLCGALCTVKNLSLQDWLGELIVLDQDENAEEVTEAFATVIPSSNAVLEQLFAESQQALQGDAMDFALLLPDDDQPLAERVAAMAQWVAGFLYGFGTGAVQISELPAPVSEALQDFTQIARANPEEVMESEEDENAYSELVEYLRAAVQVVYDELAQQRLAQVSSDASRLN